MDSPEKLAAKERQKKCNTQGRLVGDVASPFGMFPVRVEAVGLVTGLHGTGSDPAPSPQRSVLLDEMQRRGVDNPNTLLASRNASMVLVRRRAAAGHSEGRSLRHRSPHPGRSETTSLRGGYLLETRLAELAVLDGMVHTGRERGVAQGPVLVDPTADPNKERTGCHWGGRNLGRRHSIMTRALGLVIKPEHRDVVVTCPDSGRREQTIPLLPKGIQVGDGQGHTDGWIETGRPSPLQGQPGTIHAGSPVHRHPGNVCGTDAADRRAGEEAVRRRKTAAQAAVQLEAIGTAGVETSVEGAEVRADREVQIYSAEALAYLGRREAAPSRWAGQPAIEPAFRVSCP